MPPPTHLLRFAAHDAWANTRLLAALAELPAPPAIAIREMAHILGAHETWLARIEGRAPVTAIWPDLPLKALIPLAAAIETQNRAVVERLDQNDLDRLINYTNSAGVSFATPLGDILIHVALHSQYHRGKVNVALRDAGYPPVPTDYIAFARGVAAATSDPRETDMPSARRERWRSTEL